MVEEKKSKSEQDQRLSKELSDTFPASDPPSITQPGGGITGSEDSGMHDNHLERIRERAYAIWLAEGQCHGRDQEHWKQAEREIDSKE